MLGKDATILVCDDMKLIRKTVIRYLNSLGYENIIEAENGVEAVKLVKENSIDFMFIDMVMPHMNGNEALKLIHELDPWMNIVVLTSVADKEMMQDIRESEELERKGAKLRKINV
jgi:CheY-like chemotaxis protein